MYETYSENIGLYMKSGILNGVIGLPSKSQMKSKQLPHTEKCICIIILFVNSFYKFSEIYLSYGLNFTTNK